jgi:TatD DNase family protein
MRLVDTHCHLDDHEFDGDRDAVLERARDSGVDDIVIPAIDAANWDAVRVLCDGRSGLFPAYGLHPLCLAAHRPEHLDALRDWIGREQPVAVGECGLDYFVDGLDHDMQQGIFDAQLRIARDFDLPVIVHARRAVDAVIASLRRIGGLRGVVHSFSGSLQQAEQLWTLGFRLGLGGPVTYPRANRLRGLAATMPLEFLVLETDAPDQPVASHRGGRNEPGYVHEVAATIAELRGTTVETIAEATTRNALELFDLPERPLTGGG